MKAILEYLKYFLFGVGALFLYACNTFLYCVAVTCMAVYAMQIFITNVMEIDLKSNVNKIIKKITHWIKSIDFKTAIKPKFE